MKKHILLITVLSAILLLGVVPAWAATINVPGDYPTIQQAIDNSTDGDTINVAAGAYNEDPINISTSITLNGAQANVEPVDGGRAGGESVVNGQIDIWADNVTVNGFEIPNRHDGICGRNNRALHQNVQMLYNYIHSNVGGAVGINLICDNPTVDTTTFKNYVISHNYINLSVSTRAAIGLNEKAPDISKNYVYDGLEISYNEITIPKGMAAWTANDPSITTFSVDDPVIEHNSIHDCDRGLSLDNLVNADINNNEFMNCDHSSGTIIVLGGSVTDNYFSQQESSHGASYLLTFLGTVSGAPTGSHDVTVTGNEFHYNNAYTANLNGGARVHTGCDAGSITFSHNNFYDGGAGAGALALKNYVAGTDLNAELNWWSDASGPYNAARNPDGLGGQVSDDVDFEPWLMDEWQDTDTEETETEEVSGSGTMANTPTGGDIDIVATGNHTLTAAKYTENPGEATTFQATGDYWDVHLDNDTGVTSLTVNFCPANSGDTIYYWDATTASWKPCSDQAYADGCITVTITGATEPSLDDLTGQEFGRGTAKAVPVFTPIGLLALISVLSIVAATTILRRRK